jgi:hypothetical protein
MKKILVIYPLSVTISFILANFAEPARHFLKTVSPVQDWEGIPLQCPHKKSGNLLGSCGMVSVVPPR